MDTDGENIRGSQSSFLSVCIRVHPWLKNFLFPIEQTKLLHKSEAIIPIPAHE